MTSEQNPSQQSSSHSTMANDPLDAIYALNIGDFVTDSFISDDLLQKISQRLANDPAKLKAQLEELVQIYSLDKTLGILGVESTQNFVLYDSVCQTLARMFQVDTCHLFQLANKDSGDHYLSLTGTSVEVDSQHRWEINIPARANHWLADLVRGYELTVIQNVKKLPNWKPVPGLNQEQTTMIMAIPLSESGKTTGVLVFERYENAPFSSELEDLALITARMFTTGTRLQLLVAQAQDQIGLENPNINTLQNLRAQITEGIADLGIHQQKFLESLSHAVDSRQSFTYGHSKSVAHVAKTLAEALELNDKTVDLVYFAGLLGSIGKVHISSEVFNRKGSLTPDEWETLRNHPNVGVSLLGKINFLSETAPYVQSQDERWDGSGSPEGLKGRSIPLGARVLAIANAYFAMTAPRPYRNTQPLTHEQALAELKKEAGSKWDPQLVEVLSKLSQSSLEA